MVRILSIALAFCMLYPTIRTATILVNYQLNKGYFAKVLCINQDKPELHCEGQCHVSTQLEENQADEQDLPPLPELDSIVKFFNQTTIEIEHFGDNIEVGIEFFYLKKVYTSVHWKIFHPPKVLVA
ncbi:hypothetical protein AAG747_03205 [Rapidithrix thailandica]|uniref:Secreted protein n=1 Tax=Rapidithrix thailandica TaxID=413964 RepID=A0AAW9S1A6_9BACT